LDTAIAALLMEPVEVVQKIYLKAGIHAFYAEIIIAQDLNRFSDSGFM